MTGISSKSADVAAIFQQALSAHQRGQLLQARSLYETILRIQPRHADTLGLMGLLAFQNNDLLQAVQLIEQAIELSPNNAAAYNNVALP